MIKFRNVGFGFPQKDLYKDISFSIDCGEHIALIGSNGSGKSTLINLIIDTDKYTYDGIIKKDGNIRFGYVAQFVEHQTEERTVYEFLSEPFSKLMEASDELCLEMEKDPENYDLFDQYQSLMDEIDSVDGYNSDSNIGKLLFTAGLSGKESRKLTELSGGEYKLLSIVKNMLLKPQLLIMDEPDVFLDLENIIALSKLINEYDGTVLVVTHNRLLLNLCFNKILHIEGEELQEFPGTFAEYNAAMLETKIEMAEHAEKFDDYIEIQEALVEKLRNQASKNSDPVCGRQLKARVSYLERLKAKRGRNPFIEDREYDFKLPDVEISAGRNSERPEIVVEDYSLKYDSDIVLMDVSFNVMFGEKIAIVGSNGSGKSSLLRDIYEEQKSAKDEKSAIFRQIYDDGSKEMSGGERNIEQLKNISGSGAEILFLDEPTSHLDMYAQSALEKAIREYKGTVLMVSHDYFTITNCTDRVILLENGTAREMSSRAYRKMIYKKYFSFDVFNEEKLRKEKEIRINGLLKKGKIREAKEVFNS